MDRGWSACNINTLRVGWATHGRLVDKIKYVLNMTLGFWGCAIGELTDW
jgi:hypothetical protein